MSKFSFVAFLSLGVAVFAHKLLRREAGVGGALP
jgi:hypothetical protein